MAEVETRLSIQPIEELLNQRAHLVNKVADLRAKYGAFGTFDALRKIELSRLKALLRAQYTQAKAKVSNDQLDDEAHAHVDYISFITIATQQRASYFRLEAEIEAIDSVIMRANTVAKFAAQEARF